MKAFQILNDPQTSGGLLISINPANQEALIDLFNKNNLQDFIKPIGVFKEASNFKVNINL
jgi:selenophosphate synthase